MTEIEFVDLVKLTIIYLEIGMDVWSMNLISVYLRLQLFTESTAEQITTKKFVKEKKQ